jgi:hypothetical protein
MNLKLRTILIGLISLAAVLAVFMFYNQISKEPQSDIDRVPHLIDVNAQGNISDVNGEIGRIAGVGIFSLSKPVFQHLKNGKVDRELGFEELLHQVEGQWEVEKPYINVFQTNFKCFISADTGRIQVDTAGGRPNPKDATLAGNVVIHVLPESGSNIKESFIYLDDLVFVSEESSCSTAGKVKFISEDADMAGSGMELLYNSELERLELFKIIHVESLHLRGAQKGLFSGIGKNTEHSSEDISADNAGKSKEMLTAGKQATDPKQGEYYKCVLSKNVVIDAAEQLIFAKDSVSINNIFWQRASEKESKESRKAQTTEQNDAGTSKSSVSPNSQPTEPAQESRDTIVTCDNGIVVIPMSSDALQNNSDKPGSDNGNVTYAGPAWDFNDIGGRTTFITGRIEYDVSTGDAVADGPSELTSYVDMNDFAGERTNKTSVPLVVTSKKDVVFLSAKRQTVFEGDCVCSMLRAEPNNIEQKYTLSAPKLVANIGSRVKTPASHIEHLTAEGGIVKLRSVKKANGELLGGVELDCLRADYDAGQELFTAMGPGMIRLNNSKAAEPNERTGGLSLRQPCYAFLRDFATLKYFPNANRIVADAEPGRALQIIYIPVVQGKYDEQQEATATHAEAVLAQTVGGQTELSTLTATGAISYKDKENTFTGGKLLYDHQQNMMKIQGDGSNPCYYNGTIVDEIEYYLATRKVKFRVVGPSILQVK